MSMDSSRNASALSGWADDRATRLVEGWWTLSLVARGLSDRVRRESV